MKEILNRIVDKLFDNIPFSKNSEDLKEEINNKLNEKYQEEIKNESELKSLGKILNNCDNLENTCKYLSCEYNEDILNNKNQSSNKKINKNIKTLKKYIIIKSFLIAFTIITILLAIVNLSFNFANLRAIIFELILLFIVLKLEKKKYNEIKHDKLKFNLAGKKYIYDFYDKYSKKFLNFLMIELGFIAYFIIFTVISIAMSQYKLSDLFLEFSYMNFIFSILTAITLKNYFYRKLVSIYFSETKNKEFNKYILKTITISIIYFTLSLIIIYLLRNIVKSTVTLFVIFEVIYFIIILILNLTTRKHIVFNNININMKKITVGTLLVLIFLGYNIMNFDFFLTEPFINRIPNQLEVNDLIEYNEETGVYTITTNKENYKILQLTDIHLGGSLFSYSKDIKALKACLKLIETTKPDFVVVTGDLVFPMGIMSLSLNNNAPVQEFASFMRNTGIPWAFTYGNHDTESMSKLNKSEFNELMKSLSYKTSRNLLYPYIQPDIYGRNNQRIEIKSTDGSIIQELYLIDSNDYIANSKKLNEYDYIHDDQVRWYRKSLLDIENKVGYMPKSMIFFHIPIKDYKYINDLYESGSQEVIYHYGILGEKMIDKICTSNYDSKLFEEAVNLGSTQAMFFGHDHYNNQSLEYKGIRLTYGYSIDYLVMPGIAEDTEQRGGTLITIDKNGESTITPYKLNDIKK